MRAPIRSAVMSTQSIPPAPRPAASAPTPLSNDWLQWVAEQRLRACTAESMLVTMQQAGIDPGVARRAIQDTEQHPYYLAAQRIQQLQRKLESVMGNLQQLWESNPDYAVVEKRADVSTDEFIDRYVRGCRPVVLTDIARDWPAMRRWTPDDLKSRFGHLEVDVQSGRAADPRFEMNKLAHRRTVRLGDFVDQVCTGGETNDYYLTANNELLRRAEFKPLLDDIGTLPALCDRARLADCSSFWFGPGGTVTSLHHDTLMLFHTQIFGRKRWRFVSPLHTCKLYNYFQYYSPVDPDAPDLQRYPDFADVRMLEVVLEPGETVFLPLAWWHQVRSLGVSISFSYSNLTLPNHFTYINPTISNW
jgi:Cupin-like domain